MHIIPIPGFAEPVSSLTHLVAAAAVLFLSGFMIGKGIGNRVRLMGLILYTFCALFLFSMSGVYHLLDKGTTANYVLRILDHSGIYLLIAGTFTPLHLILMRKARRWLTLTIIWIMAITGLTLTAVFFSNMNEGMILSFFLMMGWMSVFTIYSLYKVDRKTAYLVIYGGLAYTAGAVIDFLRWPILIDGVVGSHEIFHVFVMIGAGYHWYAIYRVADVPISQKLTLIVNNYFKNQIKVNCKNEKLLFEAESEMDMREKVKNWMKVSYPKNLYPKSIKYQFIKEEVETLQ